jgi:two-component system sensor histidine kinase FlrB
MNVTDKDIKEKELLSRAFEAFNSSISKLRKYQGKLESRVEFLNNELHLKNQELTDVLQSLSSGLVVTDLNGIVKTFNRAAVGITGIKKERAVGQHINQLLRYPLLPKELNDSVLEKIDQDLHQNFTYYKKPEHKIIINSSTTIMESDENERQGIIINLNDITTLKRLEEEAERKNRLTAMGEIAMQVAHEIRNPLGSIELFVSMMKKDFYPDSAEMELMNHITSATQSMNHIISNLLEYTRPKPITMDILDCNSIIEKFVEFARFSATQQSIDIELTLQATDGEFRGNLQLIKQIFHNLFTNACQAMPEGGILKISTDNYHEYDQLILERFQDSVMDTKKGLYLLRVLITDEGKGMTEEVKKRLFDPFFTTREQGTGLGMSIVYKTMLSHGGLISVESALSQGTTVRLLFPVFIE